jgi:hypothetical protein
MTNEGDSVRIALEALLLIIYACNSVPIPGTDLPCSLVALGQVFSFPIDFSAAKHLELVSSPKSVISYAKDQATLLASCYEVAKILLEEHCSWHRALINALRPDPCIYSIGNIVFVQRATKSVASKGRVGKLMYSMTGSWRIIKSSMVVPIALSISSTRTVSTKSMPLCCPLIH